MTEFEIVYMRKFNLSWVPPTGYYMTKNCLCLTHNGVRYDNCTSDIQLFTEVERERQPEEEKHLFEPILRRLT